MMHAQCPLPAYYSQLKHKDEIIIFLSICVSTFMSGYFVDASERLRKIREEGLRCSEEVVEIWEDSLADNIYKLGDEGTDQFIYIYKKYICLLCYIYQNL